MAIVTGDERVHLEHLSEALESSHALRGKHRADVDTGGPGEGGKRAKVNGTAEGHKKRVAVLISGSGKKAHLCSLYKI